MAGERTKLVRTVVLVAACLLLAQASPGFSSPGRPADAIVLAVGPVKHVIRSGDTISLLAKRYGVPASAIMKANPGVNPARLSLGRELIIPMGNKGPGKPAATAGSIELRPEKAPQATKPLAERDLTATPAEPAAARQAAAETAVPATKAEAPKADAPARATAATEPKKPVKTPADQTVAPVSASHVSSSATGLTGRVISELVLAVVILALLFFFLRGFCVNLAAGVAIGLLRFFRLGDTIRVAGHEGRVIARGWLYVTLRTLDNDRVFITNARLLREILVVLPSSRDDIEV